MAAASPSASPCGLGYRVFRNPSSSNRSPFLFFGSSRRPPVLRLQDSPPPTSSSSTFARRRNNTGPAASGKANKQGSGSKKLLEEEDDNLDEDAFEALFAQLEEDLKNDNILNDDVDDEISEEDLAKLEKELEDAIGELDTGDFSESMPSDLDSMYSDEEDEIERMPKLKNWQLRRLAAALKIGRRKTNIKSLAAELGLDRALVLDLLREPPPNLLLISASLPDKVEQNTVDTESKHVESPPTPEIEVGLNEAKPNAPIHVLQTRWSMQKRLKKVQVETLERVYYRSKRPTNAMISSIVHVTNLPWKTVVKWFEDKRLQDGVPAHRAPFQRSVSRSTSDA